MRCKALQVTVEMELHAITCPGVWLCPSGSVTAHFNMLGTIAQSGTMKPIFPILCHERFVFQKTFYDGKKLTEIDKYLNKGYLYVELIQWKSCETGTVLATFKSPVSEVLYPSVEFRGAAIGVDVDLLMIATSKFPGIIAPILEVSTKTTIAEIVCKYPPPKEKLTVFGTKPKRISRPISKRPTPIRQKAVCHSYEYHRARTAPVPCRRDCCTSKAKHGDPCVVYRCSTEAKPILKKSVCSHSHSSSLCDICRRYKNNFEGENAPKTKGQRKVSINKEVCICSSDNSISVVSSCSSSVSSSPDRCRGKCNDENNSSKYYNVNNAAKYLRNRNEVPRAQFLTRESSKNYSTKNDLPKHHYADNKSGYRENKPDLPQYESYKTDSVKPQRNEVRLCEYEANEMEETNYQKRFTSGIFRSYSPDKFQPMSTDAGDNICPKNCSQNSNSTEEDDTGTMRINNYDRRLGERSKEYCLSGGCCNTAFPRITSQIISENGKDSVNRNKQVRKKNTRKGRREKIRYL